MANSASSCGTKKSPLLGGVIEDGICDVALCRRRPRVRRPLHRRGLPADEQNAIRP